jgi:hypothetical protein
VSVFAAATGVGSWPGSTPREAAEIVIGELHQLPHLVELPDRGVGADLIGRAGGLLVDIAIDTVTRGYRIAARPGAVMRRARSLLDEDIDALEEAWEKAGGRDCVVKVQAPGPITLAAQLELANGHRAITDAGAVRDLTASLAEGASRHRAEVARRLEHRQHHPLRVGLGRLHPSRHLARALEEHPEVAAAVALLEDQPPRLERDHLHHVQQLRGVGGVESLEERQRPEGIRRDRVVRRHPIPPSTVARPTRPTPSM